MHCCFLSSDRYSFGPPFGISDASRQRATPNHWPNSSGMSPCLGNHSKGPSNPRHTPAACFLTGCPGVMRNVFTRLRKCRETHCLTLEFRFFGLSWRTHILEFKLFLIDRGLKARSLWIPYLSLRNIAFEASCVGRVTHRLKTLALRSIFSSNFP